MFFKKCNGGPSKPQASSLKPQASSLKPQASSLKPQDVESFDERNLTDVMLALEKLPFPEGNRIAIMGTVFRSAIEYAVFHSAKFGLPALSTGAQRKIREVFPQTRFCRNPVDIRGIPDGESYAAVLEILLAAPETDMLFCQGPFDMDFAAALHDRTALTEKIAGLLENSPKPVFFCCPPEQTFQCPLRDNIASFPNLRRAIHAARFLIDFRNTLELKITGKQFPAAVSYS